MNFRVLSSPEVFDMRRTAARAILAALALATLAACTNPVAPKGPTPTVSADQIIGVGGH
jgi:hypothetical protein